ncbi:unnamed protein product [Anisakis simplex]|uniref:Heat shock 70 kDa protein F, mitochondrial (inferred by orthology to a C. elegans protein) n=1 Tax=Anisakis simplex TaxID=6269 RepID=A0A0M3JM12_ANISI|nr:unnamed protein product [Anisakis simplex]
MVREAEKNAAADAERKEKVEIVNQAESIIHDTDSKMTEFQDQLPAEESAALRKKLDEVRQLLTKKDTESVATIREAIGSLQQQSLKLFEAAYKKMAEKNQAGGAAGQF